MHRFRRFLVVGILLVVFVGVTGGFLLLNNGKVQTSGLAAPYGEYPKEGLTLEASHKLALDIENRYPYVDVFDISFNTTPTIPIISVQIDIPENVAQQQRSNEILKMIGVVIDELSQVVENGESFRGVLIVFVTTKEVFGPNEAGHWQKVKIWVPLTSVACSRENVFEYARGRLGNKELVDNCEINSLQGYPIENGGRVNWAGIGT